MQNKSNFYKSGNRRNFFAVLGKGIAGLFILNLFPFRMLGQKVRVYRKSANSIKALEHPLAVKTRNKKG